MYRVEKIDGKAITGKPRFLCEDCLGDPRYSMDKAVHEFKPSRLVKKLKTAANAKRIAESIKEKLGIKGRKA
jgi:hypothetical protein